MQGQGSILHLPRLAEYRPAIRQLLSPRAAQIALFTATRFRVLLIPYVGVSANQYIPSFPVVNTRISLHLSQIGYMKKSSCFRVLTSRELWPIMDTEVESDGKRFLHIRQNDPQH